MLKALSSEDILVTPNSMFKAICQELSVQPKLLHLKSNILLNSILDQISALGTGAPEVKHFEATAGQTTFVLDNNIRGDVFWFKNGSMTHEAPVSAIVGQKDVVLPAQPEFTNISIVS